MAESWYQLPAEEDASVAMLSEAVPRGEQTDFPSLEEGTLLSDTEIRKGFSAGRAHTLQLEVQDSRLSPCLPLLTTDSTPGDKFFEDTLFQKTEEDEFAPLRASLDISEFPGPPPKSLQISDVVELTSKEITLDEGNGGLSLSRQYSRKAPRDTGDGHREKEDKNPSADNEPESVVVHRTSSNDIIQPVGDTLGKELRSEDGAFLSSTVPAPVLLELLEKEVGMSSSSGRSSKSSSTGGAEKVHGMRGKPDPEEGNLNTLELGVHYDLRTSSNQSLEESFRDASEIDFSKDVEKEADDPNDSSQLKQSGITLRPSRDALHQQLFSEILQRSQERDMSGSTKSRKDSMAPGSSPVLNKTPTEPPNKVDDTSAEAHLRDELSMSSRCSIERGHKDTDILQTGNTPVDETLFIGRLPHPISQSTPGTFTVNRKPLSGRIQQIKAKLTGSDMSLNEEPSSESPPRNVAPSAVPQSIQSSQGYPESSDSQRSLSPQRRRIQSLPSLNYIEKVGAWNTNQSFDALVLRGLTGVSPKKLAYNAVADSLNRMLSKQTGTTATPKKALSASLNATSSMTNLSAAEKGSSIASAITRSQSYNSVLPARDQTEEVRHATKSKTSQSLDSLRGSSSTRGPSVGGHDLPSKQISSDLKEVVRSGQEEVFNTSGKQSRNVVTMDRFSDVSSEQDYANSSHSSHHEKEMVVGSRTSGQHQLTKEGGSIEWSPTEETSGKEELDIEGRIPTYLRNLGIDQSPTAILTPFALKGPIREPEFLPSELRTIKGSTATPSRSMRLSEGGSQSAVNISQSSLYSSTSTTSVSIPMGSEVGPESPLPTEMSPSFGLGSANDRPISQDDTMPRGVGNELRALSTHVEMSPALQPTSDLNSACQGFVSEDHVELTQVKYLIEQSESGGSEGTTSHDIVNDQVPSLQGYPIKPPSRDLVNDSFVGSKTLKEIQKLLAEAEDAGLDRTGSSLHRASPIGDPYTEAPSRSLNLEDSLHSRSATPLDILLKDMSWDSSFNSSLTGDHSVNKDLSVTWNNDSPPTTRDSSYLELVENRSSLAAPFTLQSQWGRSEPEGCSKATTNKMVPSKFSMGNDGAITEKVQRSQQLLSGVSSSVMGLRNALAVTGPGFVQGTELESDESSGDSLAARVTSLLKNDNPLAYTVRAMQDSAEEERRTRGSMKIKLTSHPVIPDSELSDEDRRRIEEIKRELLESAKEAEKDHPHPIRRASSGDAVEFQLRLTPSPLQLPVTNSNEEDTKDITSVQAFDIQRNATYGGRTEDVSSVVSAQSPPMSAPSQQDPITELQYHETPRRNVSELDRRDAPLVKSTEEATKPISSITFSSRKRSSPPSSSPDRRSPPLPFDLHVDHDKSPTNHSFDLRPPPASLNVHHVYHPTPSPSRLEDKRADTALVTSQRWRSGDSTTQEFSASSWARDKECSTVASPLTSPSIGRFDPSSGPQKQNVDPEKVNSEALVINYGCQVKSDGGDSQLTTCSGPKADGDGSPPSMSSPTRKALSCVHVTISPKEDMKVIDVSKALVTLDTGLLALEPRAKADMSRSSSANLSRNEQVLSQNDLSAGTEPSSPSHVYPIRDMKTIPEDVLQFTDKENIPDRLIHSERRRSPLSDATTQITTESPQKTSFSAEIFVDGSLREASTSSILKVNQTPEHQTPSRTPLSCLSRATDQPLLLPYRPPGSPELFYVPVMEGGSRMSPVSTIESSHPGSNDAISPKFPPDVLGSAPEKFSDPSIPKHRDGIYSKEPSPKTAERRQKLARDRTDNSTPSQYPSAPASRQTPAAKDPGSKMSFSVVHHRGSESTKRSDPRGPRVYTTSTFEDEFLPLQPEMDYSQDQSDLNGLAGSRTLEVTERKKTYSVTSKDLSGRSDKSGQSDGDQRDKCQSVTSNQSLDDLWARYTESKRRRTTESSNRLEVSLVERLERLARLLQNPPPHSLRSSKDEEKDKHHQKKAAREQWYRRKLGVDSAQSVDDGSVGKPYEDSPDTGSLHSDPSTVTDDATTTESQTSSDISSGTGSVSTIDTIRLINAFGPERVLPSSRLGRLYSTIDLQKKRTEEKAKGSKQSSTGREQSRMEMQELLKSQMADAESVTSSSGLWEPSPALRQKKSSRGLNKGVQAGELEIVMSATRRNTRDVGTTFPSPGGERLMSDPAPSVTKETSTRTARSKVNIAAQYNPPGMSWFVPAEDLKSESRKENEPRVRRGPGPAWYEPVTSTKPWREPLREKNEQEWVTGRSESPILKTRVIPSAQDKPFIRVTLQESLRSHRPDFIFRSGERVKRLQLLTEERKLQSVFQGEREELFNQARRSGDPRYKGPALSEQNRSIPKKEMIQRSKRIYQQLPEIRKRKEEEKRRSEYESNRLRAQLYRKKLTNHILGRKTPWN
ncbi:centrosome-associated protein ALMS1 [Leptodactylus fuscus]